MADFSRTGAPAAKPESGDIHTFTFHLTEADSFTVRAILIGGDPWFVATDVCTAVEVQNVTQAAARLDEDERSMFNIGRQGSATVINESGLYSLILGSRKPAAKKFKRWVTAEVLPTLRKTGQYVMPQAEPASSGPAALPQSFAEALRLAADQAERIERQNAALRAAAPKVAVVDDFLDVARGKDTNTVAKELAKVFDIGRTRLLDFLRDRKVLDASSQPYQVHIDAGRFYMQPTTFRVRGKTRAGTSLRITPKGEFYIRELLQRHGCPVRATQPNPQPKLLPPPAAQA